MISDQTIVSARAEKRATNLRAARGSGDSHGLDGSGPDLPSLAA